MTKYNFITRIVSFALAIVLFAGIVPPANAAATEYNKTLMDQILNEWNKTSYSKSDSKSYEGATQCAAFTRYVFMKLWGHTDGQKNKDNTVSIARACKTRTEMLNHLIANAKPGDSIRVTKNSNGDGGHIFHLFNIDSNNKLHIYDSNYGGTKDPKNVGRFNIFTLDYFVGSNEMGMASTDKYGKFSRTVYVTIIHAKNNTGLQFTCSGIKLNPNGGIVSQNSVAVKNGVYGSMPKPVREGYVFKGWYTAKSGGTKVSTGSKAVDNGNFTLYAQWSKCSHKQYYGGICKSCSVEAPYKITAMKATPYKVIKSGNAQTWGRPYSENSPKIRTYKKNSIVSVIGKTTNVNANGKPHNVWYLLSDGSWIYSGNVKKANASNIYYVVGTNGILNIRASASNSGRLITMATEGASVIVNNIKSNKNWKYVTYNGSSGYVPAANLVTLPSSISFYKAIKDTALKASANPSSKTYETIHKGETVAVFTNRSSGNYYFIPYFNFAGFVAKNDLKYFK